jgi:MFS family permease
MKFDELAEIYTSMTLRSLGFGIIGIFVPVFLYKTGVSLQSIFLFYGLFFAIRVPVAMAAAFLVARIGPKHTIAISTIVFIFFLGHLLTFTRFEWPIAILAFWYTLANGLFFLAYNTDFSKIKDSKNGGKELGWLYIFERAGFALGPIVGGLIASFISPNLTILVAILIMLISLIPLFMTGEPVRVHQKITFHGFSPLKYKADFISLSAFNIENVATAVMWPLLVGVFIFTEDTYAKLGALIGVAMVISMFSARMFGKFIDNHKGYYLLKYGVYMNAVTHVIRTFITNGSGVVAVSIINEPTTLSYRMPLVKGLYDAADTHKGYRIVYLTWMEVITAVAKCIFCFSLFVSCYYADPITVLRVSFIPVAVISLGILLQRFPALKKV